MSIIWNVKQFALYNLRTILKYNLDFYWKWSFCLCFIQLHKRRLFEIYNINKLFFSMFFSSVQSFLQFEYDAVFCWSFELFTSFFAAVIVSTGKNRYNSSFLYLSSWSSFIRWLNSWRAKWYKSYSCLNKNVILVIPKFWYTVWPVDQDKINFVTWFLTPFRLSASSVHTVLLANKTEYIL